MAHYAKTLVTTVLWIWALVWVKSNRATTSKRPHRLSRGTWWSWVVASPITSLPVNRQVWFVPTTYVAANWPGRGIRVIQTWPACRRKAKPTRAVRRTSGRQCPMTRNWTLFICQPVTRPRISGPVNVPHWTIDTALPSLPLMRLPVKYAGTIRPRTMTCGTLTCLHNRCCMTCRTVKAAPHQCWCRPASRAWSSCLTVKPVSPSQKLKNVRFLPATWMASVILLRSLTPSACRWSAMSS